MLQKFLSALLLCTYLFTSAALANNFANTITVGGDYNYPPYEFINEDGQPAGYNVELTQAIAEVMGMKVEFYFSDWATVRQALLSGEIDALQGMVSSNQRAEQFDFSPAHAIVHQSIFARQGSLPIQALTQLAGKQVVVQKNGIMHDYLIANQVPAQLHTVETHADALRQLAAGKHDYALVANLPGLYLGKELGLSNLIPVGKPFQAQRYGYAVLKGNETLLAQFSEGLAILKNTGRQQQIYNKWLSPLQEQGLPWKKLGKAAATISALLLLILGGTVIWNRMLKRQVDKRSIELNIQQQQLIQADKMTSLGILVSGVAHEINNPAGLLLLNIPIVNDAWQDIEEILEQHYHQQGDFLVAGLAYSRMRDEIPLLLTDMKDSARRIKRIVDDLKDFARQQDDEVHTHIDINEVIATAIRLVDNPIRQATDHFKVTYADNLPLAKGNAQRIEQVLINLILNACQSLNNRLQAISVSTAFCSKQSQLVITIQDQGCGIKQENLNRLLDPFFTTKRDQGGTGLGLSVSSGIIKAHNGLLAFHSKLGQGTTVTITLPLNEKRNDPT